MKQCKYNECPQCGGHLYVSDAYEPVSYNEEQYLSTSAECESCGWEGAVLWEDPAYSCTVSFDELD
jgi:C4-type Zn-finger protein